MRTALIEAGVVADVVMAGDGYEPSEGMTAVPSDTANRGDHYDGLTFTPSPQPAPTVEALLAYAASRRYEFETSGVTVGGAAIQTDRASQALITGALLRVMRGATSIRWKAAGGFVELTAEQVEGIADAVGSHVQNAFDREADAVTGIEGGFLTTREQIEALFA